MINYDLISDFSSIRRFSRSYLFQKENVPDHSIEMALLCINFAELVPESDARDMCYRCVIHDFEESITTDIIRPIKHYDDQIDNDINRVGKELLLLNTSKEFTDQVFNAKDMNNINGYLVHIADRIQCFLKISKEVNYFGNKSLQLDLNNFIPNIYKEIESIKEVDFMSADSKSKLIHYLNKLIKHF